MQPFTHYQLISSDESGDDDTSIYTLGLNYYIKGAANKLTLEATFVDQDDEITDSLLEDRTIITVQIAAGF